MSRDYLCLGRERPSNPRCYGGLSLFGVPVSSTDFGCSFSYFILCPELGNQAQSKLMISARRAHSVWLKLTHRTSHTIQYTTDCCYNYDLAGLHDSRRDAYHYSSAGLSSLDGTDQYMGPSDAALRRRRRREVSSS